MKIPDAQYSKNQVNKAGILLTDYVVRGINNIDKNELIEAYSVLNNWRARHAYPINTFQATLRKKLKSIDSKALVAQRLKRIPSILAKLNRFEKMQLSRMQDIGGLRAVVSTIDNVVELEHNYKNSRFKHELVAHRDYITNPKDSGYRSVHLVYKYKNSLCSDFDGLFVELQIRTRAQHAWATAVETMGTYLDYALKSSEGPDQWLDFFSLAGSAFAHMESTPAVPKYLDLPQDETYQLMIARSRELGVKDKLLAFSIATQQVETDSKKGSYHLVILNLERRTVSIKSYSKEQLDEANQDYINIEKRISEGEDLQTVLVSTGSIKNLRQAYPNYFLDTRAFIKILNRIEKTANKKMHRI